tara:strand:- start:2045 stop:2737 length:693 start_codon:yes stop_codon:yes gene_type:complete
MSGYVPKRVSSTRTAMGTTDQRPLGSGSVMLGLVGGIGASNWSSRVNKRRAYASMLKKECVQGERSAASCKQTTVNYAVDTIVPVITVTSGTDTVSQGVTWVDAGATSDGGELVTTTGTVDTSNLGTYTITYTATDAAGNVGTATRTVTVVVDITAPVITVTSGTDTVTQSTLQARVTWMDAGATSDGGEIVTTTGTVDTSIIGTYTITYTAADAAGNVGTATRTVTVTA